MLELSQTLNPECEHIQGDMRTLRLGSTFDVVLVHDAIAYMTTEDDLRAVLDTVSAHLRAGGVGILVPDTTRELFAPQTRHGGHDGDAVAASATSSGITTRIPTTRPTTWSSWWC